MENTALKRVGILLMIVCAAVPYAAAQTSTDDLRKQVVDAEAALVETQFLYPDCAAAPIEGPRQRIRAGQATKSTSCSDRSIGPSGVTVQTTEGKTVVLPLRD